MEMQKPETFHDAIDQFNRLVSDPDYHLKLDVSVDNDVPTYKFYALAWPVSVTVHDKSTAFDVMNLFILGHLAGSKTANAAARGDFKVPDDESEQKPSLRQRLFGRN